MTGNAIKPISFSDPLRRSYAIELLAEMESLCISTREALWRGNDNLADIHFETIRLVGRELALTLNEMNGGE